MKEEEEKRSEYPDMDTICRLCLAEESGNINIFETKSETGLQLSIPMRVMACASLEVHSTDGLPVFICTACRLQLEKSYLFRKKCQLSDSKIRKHLRLVNAGRKSRVFVHDPDDDDDESLEFQDSITFIQLLQNDDKLKETSERTAWEESMRNTIYNEITINRLEWEENVRTQITAEEHENRTKWQNEMQAKLLKENHLICADSKKKIKETLVNENELKIRQMEEEMRRRIKSEEAMAIYKEFGNYLKTKQILSDDVDTEHYMLEELEMPKSKRRISTEPVAGRSSKKTRREIVETNLTNTETALTHEDLHEELHEDLPEEILIYGETSENSENLETIYIYEQKDDRISASEDAEIKEHQTSEYILEEFDVEEGDHQTESVDEAADDENFERQSIHIEDDVDVNETDIEKDFLEPLPVDETSPNDKINQRDSAEEISILKVHTIEDSDILIESSAPVDDQLLIFKCDRCPQAFRREPLLIRHKAVHEKSKSYQCRWCRKHFSCKSSLDRHIRIHTGEKPFKCRKCGKSFIQKEVLKRHETVHSNVKPYNCLLCDKSFLDQKQLSQHMNLKHSANPKIETFDCHLCPKKFNHNSGLSRHLQVHSGIYFACSDCGRKFNDKSAVRRHVLTIHGKQRADKQSGGEDTDADERAVQNILPDGF